MSDSASTLSQPQIFKVVHSEENHETLGSDTGGIKSEANKRKIGFLDLPGEPRNAIYKYLIIIVRPTSVRCSYTVLMHHRSASQASNKHAAPANGDLALTQTCRRLREEYLPMYTRFDKVYISLTELLDFLKHSGLQKKPVFPYGDIRIYIQPLSLDKFKSSGIDITPLLHLYKRYPELHLEFCIGTNSAYTLAFMRQFGNNERWLETFERRVESVLLYPSCLSVRLNVEIIIASNQWDIWPGPERTNAMLLRYAGLDSLADRQRLTIRRGKPIVGRQMWPRYTYNSNMGQKVVKH
ncbi:hypothetical protein CC86DRAFT_425001 [Ophiobolus disseminans]|uniref:F-box domain-containing protein n=1 Tax=Ophiobolus disseminans TaxID=1469910 RepID=A0A6A7AGV6_9PLEO|nr:hypothetical protein CC86DRAFT_425001 [Ophiobolus disseminans]